MRNSTIISKKKTCSRCGKLDYWFSKKRCKQCATIEDGLARLEQESNRQIQDDGLSELINVADDIYSKWLRLSGADENGIVTCYTCDEQMRWQDSQCGHYIKRGNLYLRFDPRNTRIQGRCCNIYKDGNYLEYSKRLNEERPGIIEILQEEATIIYKPSRHEIQAIISEYTNKLKKLQK